MLVDSVIGHPHSVRGKISRAGFTVGVIEKQAVSYRAEGVAGQNPVRDLVMNFLRVHVPHVLRVVFPSHCTSHTYELTGLLDYFSNVSSWLTRKILRRGHQPGFSPLRLPPPFHRRLLRPPRILSISPKVLWLYKANNHRL